MSIFTHTTGDRSVGRAAAIPLAAALLATLLALGCGDGPAPESGPSPAAPAADTTTARSAATAPLAAADTLGGGVTVAGRVVGQGSEGAVAGAYVVVLEPGVPFERWETSAGEETETLIHTAVRADSTGAWRVRGLPRGRRFTVMIAARGYRSAAFDLGLTVEADAPAVKTIDPVVLEPAVW